MFPATYRIELRLAAQLHDALGQTVGVLCFLGRVFEEFVGGHIGFQAVGHEVVTLVAQDADQLGGQRFIEQAQHFLTVGAVALGYRAVLDVLPCALAQGFYIRQMQVIAHFDLQEANPMGATLYRRDRVPKL